MSNFWEIAFLGKRKMWGDKPTISSVETAKDFETKRFGRVLIPGIGYGRNAVPFLNAGISVTGVEISQTAIDLAHEKFGHSLKIFRGSVDDMPFEDTQYDGIYCHALIHLLNKRSRMKFLQSCFDQIRTKGVMVFTAITKSASTYGVGAKRETDQYLTKDGLEIFFYDESSIQDEFSQFGVIDAKLIYEPANPTTDSKTEFWLIKIEKDS